MLSQRQLSNYLSHLDKALYPKRLSLYDNQSYNRIKIVLFINNVQSLNLLLSTSTGSGNSFIKIDRIYRLG